MAENREHQLVEGDAVMRVSGGGHFKQKSIKSKFVSISLRDYEFTGDTEYMQTI